jgi:hypothetical protein
MRMHVESDILLCLAPLSQFAHHTFSSGAGVHTGLSQRLESPAAHKRSRKAATSECRATRIKTSLQPPLYATAVAPQNARVSARTAAASAMSSSRSALIGTISCAVLLGSALAAVAETPSCK